MDKWDKLYAQRDEAELKAPSLSLVRFLPRLPEGKVLDLACGTGRNAIFLAGKGFHTDALDSSSKAIEKGEVFAREAGVQVNFICADLTDYEIPQDTYDLIICFNYLERSIAPHIINGLKKGGMLLYETFTKEQKAFGPPSNDDYLLGINELPHLFRGLDTEYYREGIINEEGRKKALATLLARRSG